MEERFAHCESLYILYVKCHVVNEQCKPDYVELHRRHWLFFRTFYFRLLFWVDQARWILGVWEHIIKTALRSSVHALHHLSEPRQVLSAEVWILFTPLLLFLHGQIHFKPEEAHKGNATTSKCYCIRNLKIHKGCRYLTFKNNNVEWVTNTALYNTIYIILYNTMYCIVYTICNQSNKSLKKITLNIHLVNSGKIVKYPWNRSHTHIIVALDSIDESLISHNLSFSVEESLETLFDCLQVLLTDLKETLTDRRQIGSYRDTQIQLQIKNKNKTIIFKTK